MADPITCPRCLKYVGADTDFVHTCTPTPFVRDLEKRIAELEQALHEQIDQTMKMRDLRDRFDAESA